MTTAPVISMQTTPDAASPRPQPGALTAYQPQDLEGLKDFAKIVVHSRLCGVESAADALVIMMTGAELGLSVMQSLRGIHVVSGKPVLSADLMSAVVQRSAVCEYLRVLEMTAESCTVETRRHGHPEPVRQTWTMDDARRAGLLRNPTWTKYPQAMLRARVTAQICRAVYPDVVAGLYDPEELDAASSTPSTPLPEKPLDLSTGPRTLQEIQERAAAKLCALLSREAERLGGRALRRAWAQRMVAQHAPEDVHAGIWDLSPRVLGEVWDDVLAAGEDDVARRAIYEGAARESVEPVEPAPVDERAKLQAELLWLVSDVVAPEVADQFVAVYVARLRDSGKDVSTIEDVSARVLGAMCRKLSAMGAVERGDYVRGKIEDLSATRDEVPSRDVSDMIVGAITEQERKERAAAARRGWWAAAQEPWLEGVEMLTDADATEARAQAKDMASRYRTALKASWGIDSFSDLTLVDQEAQTASIAKMGLDVRREIMTSMTQEFEQGEA